MHDPSTVVFEIRYPWRKHRHPKNDFEKTYREPFITIWHADPEKDGTDDSCGYTFPKMPEDILTKLTKEAKSEYRFYIDKDKSPLYDDLDRIYSLFEMVAWRIYRRQIEARDLPAVFSSIFNPIHNLRYKTNHITEYDFIQDIYSVWRIYSKSRRKWWQYPKWHFWHWKIQVHPVDHFKRWAFSRCKRCHKGFRWSETVCSDQWDSTGPLWFRSERDVYHMECNREKLMARAGNK